MSKSGSGWWLSSIAILAMGLAAGCEPATGLRLEGRGAGESIEFQLLTGTYRVRWSAEDAGLTDHGCLFGLTVERTDLSIEEQPFGDAPSAPRKLDYRAIGHDEHFDGVEPSLALAGGSYRLRSEGNCAWQAEILPGFPAATPTPGIQQVGVES